MKKIIFTLVLLLLSSSKGYTQTSNSLNKDSILMDIATKLNDIGFRIRGLDRYKLYPTENIYIYLKLDTMTGKIELIQWSLDNDKEGSINLNDTDLSYNTGCGTFELYPTQNMYQFLLLDKVTGRTWHVQWGFEKEKR
ncbi:hypothetical protein [Phocaeicola sp.]|uniref:hypothetical protein n=1 Tax=Phocaeicola sp. TaxID=2773926 RepID=UPI003A91526C